VGVLEREATLASLDALLAAAAAWRELGCPYEAAFATADSDAAADLQAAYAGFRRLGARPAAEAVARRLRAQGVRGLAAGPRRATLDNPSGLTARETDVLALLRTDLRNSEIAARMYISTKTVDHHVSAILGKLGVSSRREAVRLASAWPLPAPGQDGEPGTAT
jgi:DNA-binding NarL/FixJ family response regulator